MLKYNVGDFIIYYGDIYSEIGRIQKVVNYTNFINWGDDIKVQVETVFLDNGNKNTFALKSSYCDKCEIVNDNEYGNGVPMVWGDEL
jgi:hypothetical protein